MPEPTTEVTTEATTEPTTEATTEPTTEVTPDPTLDPTLDPTPDPTPEPKGLLGQKKDQVVLVDPDAPVRPDNIPEKFWNAKEGVPRIEELVKSYDEVRSRLNEKLNDESGIPETAENYFENKFNDDGEYIFRDGAENIQAFQKDDPVLALLGESAFAEGLTVNQTNGLVVRLAEGLSALSGGKSVDIEVETQKLGEHGQARIDGVEVFLNGMGLNKDQLAAARTVGKSAAGIEVIEKFMAEAGQLSIPLSTAADTTTHGEFMAEHDVLANDPESLDNDPVKRARFEYLGSILYPDPK